MFTLVSASNLMVHFVPCVFSLAHFLISQIFVWGAYFKNKDPSFTIFITIATFIFFISGGQTLFL